MAATQIRFLANVKGRHRRATLEGRPHLVVPATILGEAVLKGAGADGKPLLYTNEENQKSAPAWNHMPIVVDHPNQDGEFVSARSEAWLNARKVGILLNTAHSGKKLKTECWFDEARVKQVDKRVYDAIIANKQMEVSTGLGAEEIEEASGEFDGVKYEGIPRGYKPDHLAILPDKIGAFPVSAGGGLFANMAFQPESTQTALMKAVEIALANIGVELLDNELSFNQKATALSDQLGSRFGKPGKYWYGYILDLYEDYVIFSDGEGKLWQIGYSLDGDTPKLDTGKPAEVHRHLVYKTTTGKIIGNESPPADDPLPEEPPMPQDRKPIIDRLIANNKASEADRPHLMGLSDAIFAGLAADAAPPANPPVPAPPAPPIQANQTPAPKTTDEYLASLPPDVARQFRRGMAADKARTDLLVNTVKSAPGNKFTEEALRNMDPDVLAGIAAMLPSQQPAAAGNGMFIEGFDPNALDYSGAAGGPVLANRAKVEVPEEALPVPVMSFKNRFSKN